MAEIKPFKAWRYNDELSQNIDTLTSPLFDVVSPNQRQLLYQNPHNSIHLSVPQDNNYQGISTRLKDWIEQGVLICDPLPAIYVYYQYFSLSGSDKVYTRKGFICNIKAYDWGDEIVLRHENTMPHSVNDRIALLEASKMNFAPTHGLYSDPHFELEQMMDQAMTNPVYEVEDYQGVRDALAIIQDAQQITKFIEVLRHKQVILADGHHRYTGSLEYRKKMMKLNPDHTGKEPYNFHMMYLTNTESDDLRVLPTHRLISGIQDLNEQELIDKLSQYFILKPVADPFNINEIILGKPWAFGFVSPNIACKIRLKPEMIQQIEWDFPDIIKELDLTVLHYFVIEKVLGIKGQDQASSRQIDFSRSLPECLYKVRSGEAQLALITQDIQMNDIKKVCLSGYTLPQKSTYFYPKAICGFVFASFEDDIYSTLVDQFFED